MVVKDDDGMIWFTTFTGWADCPLGHFAPRLMKTPFLSHDEVKNGQSMIHPALPQIAFGHFAPVLMLRIIVHLAAMMRRGKISGQSFLTGFHTWSQRREDDHNKQRKICDKKVFVISGSAITLWILWIPQQTQRKSCKKYHHNLKFCGMLVNQVGDQRSSTMFLSDPGRDAKSNKNSRDTLLAKKN